jgi:pyruvate dehydrogenase E2 component (dihydrolipoamide acetyltransferase)
MSYTKHFTIPPIGPDTDAARLVGWSVNPGQSFAAGDTLLEIETDKAIVEVAAEEAGIMKAHLFNEGAMLDIKAPVAQIEVEGEAPPAAEPLVDREVETVAVPKDVDPVSEDSKAATPATAKAATTLAATTFGAPARVFATPVARSIVAKAGIDWTTLEGTGTGPEGRIVKADVLNMLDAETVPGLESRRRPAPAGPTEGLAKTKHGEIYISQWGAGSVTSIRRTPAPTAVLLHGMFGDIDTWAAMASTISRAQLPVAAIDLPCHGNSPSNVHTMDDIADAVLEVVQTQVSGPVALIGHSFGAAVAARLGVKLGDRLTAIVLLSPLGLGTEIGQSFLSGMTNADTDEALARELRKLTEGTSSLSSSYIQVLRTRLQRRSRDLSALCASLSRNGVQQVDVSGDLARLSCPAVIIQGRSDSIIPWQHTLNAPPRTALHLLPGVGHMPHWESPGLVSEIILGALTR